MAAQCRQCEEWLNPGFPCGDLTAQFRHGWPSEREALHEVADVGPAVPRRGRRSGGAAPGGLIVRATRCRGVELMVDRGERRQAEHGLDELQDRAVLVQRRLNVGLLGEWRDDPGGHAESQSVSVKLRWRDMVEEPA